MKKIMLVLLFLPALLFAEKIAGYEYVSPKAETGAVDDIKLMTGTVEETERYRKIRRTAKSTTMENYVKAGKCKKRTIYQTIDKRPNGVTATFERSDGDDYPDYNFSSVVEKKEKIAAEKARLKALQEAELEAKAKANLGL
jgi:hypothetical protein